MAVREASSVELGHVYLELHHKVHRAIDQAMCAEGLSLARAKVLAYVHDQGPLNQSTLAGLLGFAPRSVTETIDALERDGLLVRSPDPQDRRARLLTLTEAGEGAYATAMQVRVSVTDRIFGGLSHDQRRDLLELLEQLRDHIDAMRPTNDWPCG